MKRLLAGLAALCLTSAIALAAQVPLVTGPQDPSQLNATINNTIVNINAALGTYGKDPASNSYYPSYAMGYTQALLIFEKSSTTTSYAYIFLPPGPIDGQTACIYSRAAITALFLGIANGQNITNAITAASANTRYCYTYSLANSTWDRSQ